jgi:hypothetical protein
MFIPKLKNITLVDLTKIPPLPRFFQESNYNRHEIHFLNDFVVDISKSIEKDGEEYTESNTDFQAMRDEWDNS